ncbi:PTS mannose/fructose/sorbose transporter subunit IIB [Salmonella enterica subsp. diarizonae]|nr:PTS mannose/fructose/sorbose transporter subunit IIB [Salmonella enterica subsp. diarizonae]
MIKHLRIDHRLLHGQVVYSWLKSIDCNAIIIANDAVVQDETRSKLLMMSAPSDKKTIIRSLEAGAAILNDERNDKVKFFVIVESLEDAWQLARKVAAVRSINVGSIRKTEGAESVNNAVFLNEEHKVILRNLVDMGIEIEARQIADDVKIDLSGRL